MKIIIKAILALSFLAVACISIYLGREKFEAGLCIFISGFMVYGIIKTDSDKKAE